MPFYRMTLKKIKSNIWDMFEILSYTFATLTGTPTASKKTRLSPNSWNRKEKMTPSPNGPNLITYISLQGAVKNLQGHRIINK